MSIEIIENAAFLVSRAGKRSELKEIIGPGLAVKETRVGSVKGEAPGVAGGFLNQPNFRPLQPAP
jgi:hypothetical protein